MAQSKKQLDDSKLELEQAEARLTKTSRELAEADLALQTGKTALDTTKAQLEQASKALEQSQLSLAADKKQLDELATNLALEQQVWQTEVSRLEAEKQEWLVQGQDPQSASRLTARESQLAETAQRLTQLENNLQQGQAGYQSNLTIYENERSAYQTAESQYRSALEAYDLQLASYQQGKAAYEEGLTTYQQGKVDYDAGLAAYQSGLATYQSGLSAYVANQARLDQESLVISQEQDRLNSAKAELERSQSDFDRQKADAQAQMASADKELTQATDQLNQLTEPDYRVYTRQTFPGGHGYDTFKTGASAISAVGNIFPVVLYLVAALVSLTTMTSFVDEERHTIGIFKSLGFTNRAIMAKFVVYGLTASLAGTLVGVILGHMVLSSMIGNILTQKLVLGQISHIFYPGWSLVAVLLALISAVLPTYLVAHRDLIREKPAQLLQAKPPVTGSSIWLERWTFIWKRLSFTHKVTARNIFRYKQRMLMTIFGVAGSVALLFAGLGIQSSISGVAKSQFGELLTYDLILVENSRASQDDKDQLTSFLETATIAQKLPVRFFSTSETIQQTGDQTITLLVANQPQLNDFIQLRQRQTKEQLNLSDTGAIVTEKLATLYGVDLGDQLTVTLEDHSVTLTVAGISELYAGHYIYLSEAYYEKLQPKPSPPNGYLIQLKDQSPEHIKETAAEALKQHAVASVVQNTTLEMALTKTADSLSAVMLVLIALSILLAVVILYNLTTINVAECIRELSTIKVLGFHHKEVTLYIYRETIVLSLAGIMLGLGEGVYLHRLLLNMIASPSLMFQPQVDLSVYLTPVFAIAVILIVLGVLINRRLRQVDMLEALKSLE
ncbi:FtsX-like permease family protein [Streptococcus sp. E29BA]|uniref:FtsX-like permease family protein n=1 Tax=Streptococcus sp. E29BA TaxID=3278716 RepID=UPI00359E2A2A